MKHKTVKPGQVYKIKVDSFCNLIVNNDIDYQSGDIDINIGDKILVLDTFVLGGYTCLYKDKIVSISHEKIIDDKWFERIF